MTRVPMTQEQAIELLRQWSSQKRTVYFSIGFERKFMLTFFEGKFEPDEADARVFRYSQAGMVVVISPYHFEQCERAETDDMECVIFSDGLGTNGAIGYCPKGNKPVPVEQFSKWLN